MSRQHVTLVYNRKSGSAVEIEELRRIFSKHEIEIDSAIAIGEGFERKLRAPIESGNTIAVVGGDGTVSAVASLVAGTRATLLPLPGGTLNNFTKDLRMPQDVDEALGRAMAMKPRMIDIARVNDTYFINNSSIGLYPQSLRTRERIDQSIGKWPAALWGVCRAFVRLRTYTVTIDGETFRTPFIFVGNNDYRLERSGSADRKHLHAGILSVYIVKTVSRLQLIRLFVTALFGRHRDLDSFDYHKSSQITITSRRHGTVHVSHDGEVGTVKMPVTYRIDKAKLRILG